MFPIVMLLALSGLVVGMLNSFEHFAVPALAPVAWNLVIIAALVGLVPVLPEDDEIYAYAIGILAGTVVQFLLPLPWLRGRGGRLTFRIDWRDERVLRVLKLMLPVTIALGLINLSLLINSIFGTLVSPQAPAAIDKAFRIYQLPQGLFSIAIATILFPTMSRFAARGARDDLRRTMGNGVRQICLLLIPSAVLMAVLAEPITRLVYQRGAFGAEATDLTSTALSGGRSRCPFQGVSLLFSRTFFSLQRPWATTALAGVNLRGERRRSPRRSTAPSRSPGSCSARWPARSSCASRRAGILRRELAGIEGGKLASSAGPDAGRRGAARRACPTSPGRASTSSLGGARSPRPGPCWRIARLAICSRARPSTPGAASGCSRRAARRRQIPRAPRRPRAAPTAA